MGIRFGLNLEFGLYVYRVEKGVLVLMGSFSVGFRLNEGQ